VALNSLFAPDGFGCLDASVALGVPITFLADVTVVVNYISLARWDIICKLLPPTGFGVAIGTQLMGRCVIMRVGGFHSHHFIGIFRCPVQCSGILLLENIMKFMGLSCEPTSLKVEV